MSALRNQDFEKKSNKLRIAGRLLLVAVIAVAGLSAYMYRDSIFGSFANVLAASDDDPIPVQVLEKGPYQLAVPGFGEITGFGSTPIALSVASSRSRRGGGLKIAWLIPEGDFVAAGDPVVRFDSTDAQLNLETQENLLAANQQRFQITTGQQETNTAVLGIDRQDAQKDYEYAMTVLPEDEMIFSKWDIIEAKINAGFAKEKIDVLTNKARVQKRIDRADQQILTIEKNKAETEMQIAKQTLDSLVLASPVDGLVVYREDHRRDPQVGDETWPGQVLADVVDLSSLQARIYVLERDAGSLAKGKAVTLRLDAMPRKAFHGVVRSMAALAQPLERNSPLKYFACEVVIQDAGEDLKRIKPGMSLEAEVILEKYDSCFVVPASAVTTKGTENLVYVRNGDQFQARPVQIGQGLHGQAVILGGIEANQVIALRNPFETRKAYLPDFSKGAGNTGGGRRMMMMRGGGPH